MRPKPPVFRRPRIEEKRRGVRMNSRVPVAIEWKDGSGNAQREEAFTRVVGPYGCLAVVPANLAVEQQVRVVNLANEQVSEGAVVWKGLERGEGWEVGIELTQPPMDFWGLDL